MKRTRFLAILVLCAAVSMLLSTATTFAQGPSPAVIESYLIQNIDGSDVTDEPLMAGATYTVTFEVNVGVDLANTTLILSTPMSKVGDIYWRLENDYPGVDTQTWQPGQPTIEFDAVKGTAEVRLDGFVPTHYTSEKLPNGDYLHTAQPISLVQLFLGPAGTLLDERPSTVKDQAIDAYQDALTQKTTLLQTTTADAKYESLAAAIISQAETLSGKGYVEIAKNLLNTIPASAAEMPVPVEESSFIPYLIVIIVLAVILIAFLVLFLRARSNASFVRQQVDEESGKLDVLSVRLSKIDRQLARDIEQVKEQLERISGR
jgi:hypothetical protein